MLKINTKAKFHYFDIKLFIVKYIILEGISSNEIAYLIIAANSTSSIVGGFDAFYGD